MKIDIKYATKAFLFTILLFMFIYAVPINSWLNSSYISLFIVTIFIFVNKSALNIFNKLISLKITHLIAYSYIFIIIYSLIISYVSETHDIYIIKTWINNLISLYGAIIFITLFILFFNNQEKFEKFIFLILLIQSIYIIAALLLPDMSIAVQTAIRSQEQLDRMSIYSGVRGLSLSGSLAFGLAITMSLLGLLSTYWLFKFSKTSFLLKVILLLICIAASLSAGRTAILGFIFGIFLALPSLLRVKTLFSLLITIIIVSVGFIVLYNTNPTIYSLTHKYSGYVFEPITLFLNTGSFKVTSLQTLESMYFLPNLDTLLFGDVKYVDENDRQLYYMGTDSGYMRFILYYGLIGSLYPYLLFIFICLYTGIKSYNQEYLPLFLLIIIMSFIFQYKGETVYFSVAYMKIIFCLIFYSLNKKNFSIYAGETANSELQKEKRKYQLKETLL